MYRTDLQGTVTVVVQPSGQFAITTEKGPAVATNRGKAAPTPAPVKVPATPATYRSCAAARAAGVTPLRRGQPGYSPALDRDGDGVACE